MILPLETPKKIMILNKFKSFTDYETKILNETIYLKCAATLKYILLKDVS